MPPFGRDIGHRHLQSGQADAQKAHPAPPVRIHLAPEARQADGVALQTARQQQSIDPLCAIPDGNEPHSFALHRYAHTGCVPWSGVKPEACELIGDQ